VTVVGVDNSGLHMDLHVGWLGLRIGSHFTLSHISQTD